MQLLDLTCPSCGASVANRLSSRRITCEYCGTTFLVDGENFDEFMEEMPEVMEDDPLSGLSISRFAEEVCKEFLANNDQSYFKDTPKVRTGLGIHDGDTVFLIHDDTMFHSGKNGFAITRQGLYCRGMYEAADFMDWDTFGKASAPEENPDNYISCGTRKVCYLTGNSSLFNDGLIPLYQRLHRQAGKH